MFNSTFTEGVKRQGRKARSKTPDRGGKRSKTKSQLRRLQQGEKHDVPRVEVIGLDESGLEPRFNI